MSYTPGFAPDARSQWQALEPKLQELVLGELDRLALDPPLMSEHVADVVLEEKGTRHYLFVHVLIDRPRKTVTVVGVGSCVRSIPQ